MIITVNDFKERVSSDMPTLVNELQAVTGRYGDEEAKSWQDSLPRLSRAFSASSFNSLHLYFNGSGALSLEYQLPAASSWCDVVLLGKKNNKPGAVIIELKHWQTYSDKPGKVEGLINHFGSEVLHPSDQVRGYSEYCRRYHSAVLEQEASVKGCVLFTRDVITKAYKETPNDSLVKSFPCFTLSDEDIATSFPQFIQGVIEEADYAWALDFESGSYKQDRGFVEQIGGQILNPEASCFELLDNQRRAFALCRARVNASLFDDPSNANKKVILVEGPPGSGKSVVAAKIWAALATDKKLPDGPIVFTSTSASQNSNWSHLFNATAANVAAAGVVKKATSYTPLTTQQLGRLRTTHNDSKLFKDGLLWREHLKTLKALGNGFHSGTRDSEFLVSVVDEAHALINPEHVEGRGQFGFVTGLGPQAYHIMRVSQVSIFLMDSKQSFRTRENTTTENIKAWAEEIGAEYSTVSLEGSQFRCAGSKEYVDWLESVLRGDSLETCKVLASAWNNTQSIPTGNIINFPTTALAAAEAPGDYGAKKRKTLNRVGLEFKIFDTPKQMEQALRDKLAEGAKARILASYAREWKTRSAAVPHDLPDSLKDFSISYSENGETRTWSNIWNFVPQNGSDYATYIQGKAGSRIHDDPLCEVGCPYAVRGFDWDYVGILWFKDLAYTEELGWHANPLHSHEAGFKTLITAAKNELDLKGSHHTNLHQAVAQAYRILLTRPIRGIYLWFEDDETRKRIESSIEHG